MADPAIVAQRLDAALRAAGVPLAGVSVGQVADKATWRPDLTADATEDDRATAADVIANFAAPGPRFITPAALSRRFTALERIAIQQKVAAGDLFLADFFRQVELRDPKVEPIDLDSADVIAGLAYLSGVTVSGHTISDPPVLAAGRSAQIRA